MSYAVFQFHLITVFTVCTSSIQASDCFGPVKLLRASIYDVEKREEVGGNEWFSSACTLGKAKDDVREKAVGTWRRYFNKCLLRNGHNADSCYNLRIKMNRWMFSRWQDLDEWPRNIRELETIERISRKIKLE